MDTALDLYKKARKLLGGEHVTLTATAYVGRTCPDGKLGCDAKEAPLEAGVAGLVSLPLLGMGGGHGLLDWYPVLQSDDEQRAAAEFQKRAGQYAEVIARAKDADLQPLQKELARKLLETLDTLTKRADEDDAEYWDVARQVQRCAKRLIEGGEVDEPGVWEDMVRAEGPSEASAPVDTFDEDAYCKDAFGAAWMNAVNAPKRIRLLAERIASFARNRAAERVGRHNLLLGPTIGVPITEDPTKTFLWGALLEGGVGDFRAGVSGGFIGTYGAPFHPTAGWFVGLAVSGEIGDDLFHFINGGQSALHEQVASE